MMERVRLQYDAEGKRQVVASPESPRGPRPSELPKMREEESVELLLGTEKADSFDARFI